MPRRRTSRRNQAAKKTGAELKAQRIIAKLRHYHEQGGLAEPTDHKAAAALAEANGVGMYTAHKARAFARQYENRELNEFCKLRRPNGMPLHWGHVSYLLSVPWASPADKARRSRLQREAAEKGWTAPELYAEIKRRFPKGRRMTPSGIGVGGRPRKGAVGSTEYLQALVSQVEAVGRGIEQLSHAGKPGKRSARQLKSRLSSLEEAIVGLRKRIAAVKHGLAT